MEEVRFHSSSVEDVAKVAATLRQSVRDTMTAIWNIGMGVNSRMVA